ncbi:MAG: hypothetical protein VYE68_07065 [Acidobacteriota bacterium]|nr:hypothetical protein [Acidobacteriota bacterium]
MRHMSVLSVAALVFTAFLTARQEGTVVHGLELDAETAHALENAYGQVPSGRY